MIPLPGAVWRYGGVFALGLLLAGTVQGWRYGAQIARAETAAATEHAEAMRLVLAEQDASAARMVAADQKATEVISHADRESARLRACIDTGRGCGLRVQVAKRPACVPEADRAAGLGDRAGEWAELGADAGRAYFALRERLPRIEEALRLCVAAHLGRSEH